MSLIRCLLLGLCALVMMHAHHGMAQEATAPQNTTDILSMATQPPLTTTLRREAMAELFIQAGALPTDLLYHSFWWNGHQHQNLLTIIPGTGEGIMVMGSHMDTQQEGTGAVDNWSSCVVLANLYHHLRATQPTSTWIFIGFAAEEHGQHGSNAFVSALPREARNRIRAMINLECLGVGHLRTWTNASADLLEEMLLSATTTEAAEFSQDFLFGYSADSFTFTRAGIPSITIHSLAPGDLKIINSNADTADKIRPERIREAYQILCRFVNKLDTSTTPITDADSQRALKPADSILLQVCHRGAMIDQAKKHEGLLLHGISMGSAEYRAGLRDGDFLHAIGGNVVSSTSDIRPVMMTIYKGMSVPLTIMRPPPAAPDSAKEKPEQGTKPTSSQSLVETTITVQY